MQKANKQHEKILWIVRTGVLIAVLIALQWATAGTQAFAGQYITGSLVNCVLAVAVLAAGLWSGVTVALLSPFCAFLLGIGPALIQIVPCISLGNCVYVVVLWAVSRNRKLWVTIPAVLLAAMAKFLTLYLTVVKLVVPMVAAPTMANKLTAMFSLPQLVTALIGGGLALAIYPLLRKGLRK